MRLVIGPVVGTLISTPDASKVAYAAGEMGVLTVHESEHKHPGQAFATLYYSTGVDPRRCGPGEFDTEKFIRTGCGKFEWRAPGEFSISGDNGRYLFRIL